MAHMGRLTRWHRVKHRFWQIAETVGLGLVVVSRRVDMRASSRSSYSSQPLVAASWNMAWNSVESIVGTLSATHLPLKRCGTLKIAQVATLPSRTGLIPFSSRGVSLSGVLGSLRSRSGEP